MTLEILTPDQTIYEGLVTSVTLPGTVGSFEILKDHAPIISTLEDWNKFCKHEEFNRIKYQLKWNLMQFVAFLILVTR